MFFLQPFCFEEDDVTLTFGGPYYLRIAELKVNPHESWITYRTRIPLEKLDEVKILTFLAIHSTSLVDFHCRPNQTERLENKVYSENKGKFELSDSWFFLCTGEFKKQVNSTFD